MIENFHSDLARDALDEAFSETSKSVPKEASESNRRNEAVDTDILHVFDEALIPSKPQRQLANVGVSSVKDVLAKRNDFKHGEVEGVHKASQQRLYNFCLWYENFHKTNEEGSSWIEHFEQDAFENFVESLDSSITRTKELFNQATNVIHDGSPTNLCGLPDEVYCDLYAYIVEQVMKKLPAHLIQGSTFEVEPLIKKCAEAIFNFPSGEPFPSIQLVAGRTQSGKSNFKAVVKATCEVMYCPLIIIAKGVAEREDLKRKLDNLLDHSESPFKSWYGVSSNKRSLVVNDTGAAITNKAIRYVKELRDLKPHGKFVVIVDECDAAYRTDESSQEFEKAFNQLMNLMPAFRIEISATPVPAWLVLIERGHKVDLMEIGTSEDYSGITDMKPLEDDNGNRIFLSPNQLRHYRGFLSPVRSLAGLTLHDTQVLFPKDAPRRGADECEAEEFALEKGDWLDFIPYTDENVMRLYDDALSQPDPDDGNAKREGILLLDCTASRVVVDENIFQKAVGVQNHYFVQGKPMVVVVFVGTGIYLRRPGFENGRYIPSKQKSIVDVINHLDQEYGLAMPIFVFGWTKMRRCISYRSDRRVPTHMVLLLGNNQSDESYIQALGRATFNGLGTVLTKNGHSHVTILTSKNDFAMARKYQKYIPVLSQLIKNDGNTNPNSVVEAAKRMFDDSCNYKRHSTRKTGQVKGLKNLLPDQSTFKPPIELDSDDEVIFIDREVDGDSIDDDGIAKITKSFSSSSCGSTSNQILTGVMRAIYDLLHEVGAHTVQKMRTLAVSANDNGHNDDDADGRDNIQSVTMDEINRIGFTTGQILDQYNDTFQDNERIGTIPKSALNEALAKLREQHVIVKQTTSDTTRSTCRWNVPNVSIFIMQCVKRKIVNDEQRNDNNEDNNDDTVDSMQEEQGESDDAVY